MEDFERKKILSDYEKIADGPKAINDSNGLAAKALEHSTERKLLTKDMVTWQKDALDVLRVAAVTWDKCNECLQTNNEKQALQLLMASIKTITLLASDNALRMGRYQLQHALEAAGAKGAYAMLALDSEDKDRVELDTSDHNLFQHAHVEAITELRKFNRELESGRPKQQRKNGSYNHKGNWRGRGGGGRGNGAWRGRGNWRGRGRGALQQHQSYQRQEQKQE